MRRRRPELGDTLAGIVLTALGRRDGLSRFAEGREAFLASLAPLIAFPLVAAILLGATGSPRLAGSQFLATVCAILAPLVVSYELARLWGRTAAWLRFATAFNWCQWTIPALAAIAVALLFPALSGSIGYRPGLAATFGLIGLYALWLHWFIARHALNISRLRAAVLVLAANLASAATALGPALLAARQA